MPATQAPPPGMAGRRVQRPGFPGPGNAKPRQALTCSQLVTWQTDRDGTAQGGSVAVTGLANLAIKVADLDAACAFYDAAGAEVRDRMAWETASAPTSTSGR